MHRWSIFAFILLLAALPVTAYAQSSVSFSSLQVALEPEYDQPSMLAIYDFKLADGVSLPAQVSFRLPKDSNLVAVAYASGSQLMNAAYSGPTPLDNWNVIKISVTNAASYHVEYYEPITKSGTERHFRYDWLSDYAVSDFKLSVLSPTDTTRFSTDPPLQSTTNPDGTNSWAKDFGALAANQAFTLNIDYTKASDRLSVPQSNVAPSQPIGPNTAGSFMSTFSNELPYILGGFGLLLIGGGVVYFWQSGRDSRNRSHRRRAPRAETEGDSEVYCHQCGTRAHKGDRFCRVCGTKLRREA